MAFSGNTIIFDDISSERFGLMLVGKIDSTEQESGALGTRISVIDDTILRRPSPIYYTAKQGPPLEFKLILSVMAENQFLSRHDLAAIAGWLYGHSAYKELSICQADLTDYFYRCKIIELEPVFVAGKTVGVSASILCDAPYAYLRAANSVVMSSAETEYTYHNRSNMNGYYYPQITICATGETPEIQILNLTTGESLALNNIPQSGATISIDCMRQILTSDEIPNVYDYCNFNFPAFIKGSNRLKLTGSFRMDIVNEFPMYIGA